jgi:hypothetical protein
MEINFNTPALLFPAISLLIIAYTTRFVALANLVRKLHADYVGGEKSKLILQQIKSLRERINLIRYMQGLGVFSFLLCVVSMYCIYSNWLLIAKYFFALSLLSLVASLVISLIEIIKSTNAIELELSDIEELEQSGFLSEIWNKKQKDE